MALALQFYKEYEKLRNMRKKNEALIIKMLILENALNTLFKKALYKSDGYTITEEDFVIAIKIAIRTIEKKRFKDMEL
jgi:hypothetical protein